MRALGCGDGDGAEDVGDVVCPGEAVGFGIGKGSPGNNESDAWPGAGTGESGACALALTTPP